MVAFDVDEFVHACRAAVADTDRRGAVREVLERAGSTPARVIDVLGQPARGNLEVVHRSAECTILHVVWTPGMRIEPHDHDMTASIVVYGGSEDNAFFRKLPDGTIEASGGQMLGAGDVCQMGPTTVHRVQAHPDRFTGALHVYAGDFFDRTRRTWSEETLEPTLDQRPVAQLFEEAESAWQARRAG